MEQYVKYLRKSRFDRDYADLSVEETLRRHDVILEKLAEDQGLYVAKTYREVVSGESIAARPEIQKLLEEVGAGIWAGVLVVDLERLARGNSIDQGIISQTFQFSGTKIITPSKTYDPSNEYDEEYFEFGLFMSRREYKTINRRLVRGRSSSASEGKYVGSIPPYGYDKVKIPGEKGYTLQPNDEAQYVKKIFEMYANHVGTGLIANYLNERQVPTRHGDYWTYTTISNIIGNPVYMGKIKRGWCKQIKSIKDGVMVKKVKHLTDPSEYELYEGRHPALVSEELFAKVQEVTATKKSDAPVKEEFELQNSFAGLLFCSICGKRIARTTMSAKSKKAPRLKCINHTRCHNSSCYYTVVEQNVVQALRTWLEGYKVKIDTVGFSEDITEYKSQIDSLDKEIAKLKAQLNKAFELIEQGAYTVDIFQMRKDKLTAEISANEEKRDKLTNLIQSLKNDAQQRTEIIPKTEALLESYDDMTPQERNDALREILYKIEYYKPPQGDIQIDLYPRLPKI